jgi:hypothetical protein
MPPKHNSRLLHSKRLSRSLFQKQQSSRRSAELSLSLSRRQNSTRVGVDRTEVAETRRNLNVVLERVTGELRNSVKEKRIQETKRYELNSTTGLIFEISKFACHMHTRISIEFHSRVFFHPYRRVIRLNVDLVVRVELVRLQKTPHGLRVVVVSERRHACG